MKLPLLRKLVVEDFGDQKSWIEKLLNPINDFVQTISTGLNKNLTFADNLNSGIREVLFLGGVEIVLKNPLPFIPAGILAIKLQEDSNVPNIIAVNWSMYWYYDYNTGALKIRFTGLTANRAYKATFLIIGG
jgi:hypothetical protein